METIETYNSQDKTTIQVSHELKKQLKIRCAEKEMTYEQFIFSLLKEGTE